ncbi:MAG: hypothetical protein BGO69_14950 [Bacteroidetes bacterium 46-16]|nr:MAG: hypothetical protein BGO69_14950 [Bacteroidetes bacterium 46-16]
MLLLMSCGKHKEEKTMNTKESLDAREQQLHNWEQQLQLKEIRLIALQSNLDSTRRQLDSIGIYNSALVGNWHVKMLCTETTCQGSAIGDTKSEQWNISYQGNRVVAKVTSNKRFNRIYSGLYKKNKLRLTSEQQPDSKTAITINLHPTSKNKMEGEREIRQQDDCKIIYTVEIEKL